MWRGWVRLTERQELGTSLALFRILIGLSALLTVGWVVWGGIAEAVWMDQAYGGIFRLTGTPLVKALGGVRPAVVYPLIAACLFSSSLLVVGLGGRVVAFLTLQLVIGVLQLNPMVGAAYDTLLTNGLWLCVLAPCTRTLSVDCRMSMGSWVSDRTVGAWGRYLIVVQLVVMYTSTGVQKLSAYWVPGGDFSAVYYILQMPNFHYADMGWVAPYFLLTQIGTAVTWFWEVSGVVLLMAVWVSDSPNPGSVGLWMVRLRIREVYILIGLIMHVSLFFLMELGPFGFTSLAFYVALVHPLEWRTLYLRVFAQERRVAPPLASGEG